METNEVSNALKELCKKVGVKYPVDLVGKVITLSFKTVNEESEDSKELSTYTVFEKITRCVVISNSLGLPRKVILKLSGSVYYSLKFSQESKLWELYRFSAPNLILEKKYPVEISFSKKWWQIF